MLRVSIRTFSSKKSAAVKLVPTHHPRIYTLDANSGHSKGTAMIVGWLYSAPKALSKYAEIYHRNGMDVCVCTPTWTHVLHPESSRQLMRDLEAEVMARQNRNRRDAVMIHSFSMGAYMTSLWLKEARKRDNLKEAGSPPSVLEMCRGHAYDSPVDAFEVPRGIGKATFMNNDVAAKALQRAIEIALACIPSVRQEHYDASDYIINHPISHAPSLWLYGDSDVISTPELIDRVTSIWEDKLHLDVTELDIKKCEKILFSKTKHVTHFRDHPEIYTAALESFLKKNVLSDKPVEGKAKEMK